MIKEVLPRRFLYKIPQFSILQWNQLNSKLCDSKSFPKINPDYLTWDFRKNLLVKELLSYNADIICLEEVDQIIFYEVLLEKQGYSVLKGQKNGGTEDWTVLAYRSSKFKLIENKIHYYKEKQETLSQFFLHAKLQLVDDERVLWVFATHLKAKDYEETRKIQTTELLSYMKQYDELKEEDKLKIGILVCGDFNAEPHYECMKDILSYMESTYKDVEFTTYKIRDKLYSRVIDYMLYGKSVLKLIGRQEIPKENEMPVEGLPNEHYPSDHLNLYGIFQYIN